MRRTIGMALALALVVAACGDDDTNNAADDLLVGNLAERIGGGQTGDQLGFSDDDAVCFAQELIESLGGERMADALQLEFEEFMAAASSGERRTVVDSLFECIDFGALMTQEAAAEISVESATCLGDAFASSEGFRDSLADSFGSGDDPFDDPDLLAEILPAMFTCLSAEEIIQLGGDS